jgi:acetolactate synthase-1/2/3 large subunit
MRQDFFFEGNIMEKIAMNMNQREQLRRSNQPITGAEAIVRSLLCEGVETIFGYPGGNIMPTYDALYDFRDRLRHILVRHEQGAVHAAQGYARSSGKVGVVIATSGPGATNLLTGIADAYIDSTPLVCIAGQAGSKFLGTDAFQEVDIVNISLPITKWSVQVKDAESIPEVIARAFLVARSGRPGPVLVDIPKDVQFAKSTFYYEALEHSRGVKEKPAARPEQIKYAAKLLNSCSKPLVLIGQGVVLAAAEAELLRFIEKSGFPVAATLLGLSSFPVNHPQYVGMLGMHGNYGPNLLTNESDLILAVGMRFDDRVTGDLSRYAKRARIVHIDIDEAEIGKNVKCDAPVLADAKEALCMLTDLIEVRNFKEWNAKFKSCFVEEKKQVIEQQLYPKDRITMGMAIRVIGEETKGEAVLVTDVGQHQMVASRYYPFVKNRSMVTSGGLGTMGFGLPASLGAALGAPNRTTVLVVGDGGLQMKIQELGTIANEAIPVKIVLLNNNFLGMVRQWQELFFEKRYSFVEMENPDFGLISQGYGIPYTKVSEVEELAGAVKAMVEHNGPYFLEVVVEKEENVFPMVPAGCAVDEVRLK